MSLKEEEEEEKEEEEEEASEVFSPFGMRQIFFFGPSVYSL